VPTEVNQKMTPAMANQVMRNKTRFSNNRSMLELSPAGPITWLDSRAKLDFRVIFAIIFKNQFFKDKIDNTQKHQFVLVENTQILTFFFSLN
jgi:hypothetical protein